VASAAPALARSTPRGSERVVAELQAAWESLEQISSQLIEQSRGLTQTGAANSLLETREQFENTTRLLVVEPLEEFLRLRPIRRSLEALQEFDRDAPRDAVRARAGIDTRFQLLLSEAALDLREPWRIHRSTGKPDEWLRLEKRQKARSERATNLLAAYQKWGVRATNTVTGKSPDPNDSERQKRVEQWWRQQGAVNSMLEIEVALRNLGFLWLTTTQSLCRSLQQEREQFLSQVQNMIQWINDGANPRTAAPVESMALATCEERLRSWVHVVEEEARNRLPENTEMFVPGRSIRWRSVHPRAVFLSIFATHCQPLMRQSLQSAWEGNAIIFREAVRSKEIIDYWRVASANHAGKKEAVFDDASNNAIAVLTDQLLAPETDEILDAGLVRTFKTWNNEGSTLFEAAEIGWGRLLLKPRGRQLFQVAVQEGRRRATHLRERLTRWSSRQWENALETFGGKLPSQPSAATVVRRANLRDVLALPVAKSELPAIYGSLFQLAPIEDQRFLVGRSQELVGLEQALKDWDAGRFAACVLVGARGSGKTSLLNCAAKGAFAGREIIRTQFGERATTNEEVDDFLRKLPGMTPVEDLELAFRAKRRVLMIEEAERTYIRKVGGFEGISHLMRWIQLTSSTTLWIIAMNDNAFRVLCAALQFSRIFSHRVNAMSVSRLDLENAVLERHRLSGLRMEFAPPPPSDPRTSRIKNLLGLDESPQKLFFDSLYQHSGGVFRSAFELWLSSIERVEGETLKIRQPFEPDFARFRGELEQADHFTLQIIQQHGSLTSQEVADVLCESPESSRGRMERLAALGLIETDPEHPGLRVRPEAYRFTNDALHRVNLQ
jgi:AAA ATPase domain